MISPLDKLATMVSDLLAFMLPILSGWYFSHPESRYFGIGKIGRHQIASLAERKGIATADMEKWLSYYLSYEP